MRFATATGPRSSNYLRYAIYAEQDGPQICDFYYWVIRDGETVYLVDSGFTRSLAEQWNQYRREHARCTCIARSYT